MKKISIVGGDLRNRYIYKILQEDFDVSRYALGLKDLCTLQDTIAYSDIVISAIPFSIDGNLVYAPFSDKKIKIDKLVELCRNKTLVAGKIDNFLINISNINIIDVMKFPELAEKNVIPTAEGIIKIIIENTNFTIDSSNIAVLGYGKIGKYVASILSKMGSNIRIYDKSADAKSKAMQQNFGVIENLDEDLKDSDVILNTIPEILINERALLNLRKDVLVLDVASKPGGVDIEAAEKIGISVLKAPGIPGKVAPYTAAMYIVEVLKKNKII